MIEGLKPYPAYKESGLPWLDTVPKHWDMAPNRALMQEQRRVVGANASDYTLLSLTLRGVIARDMENPKGKFPVQFNTYKMVKPDDFVFCLFDIDETPRGVGLSNQKGMITGAYDVFSPRRRINPRFLYHYYLFVDEGKLMKPLYTGLRKTIQRGVFASLKAPCPPLDEQAAIVRFLDHANRKIDRFIRAKRKLIGLLNEQKQAIIHRAVTRGLNPDVPFKPSGIPWFWDIPAHWDIRPLKQSLSRMDYGTSESSTADGTFRVLTMGHIQNGRVLVPETGGINHIPAGLFLETNDLLFNRTNSPELVGKVGIFAGNKEPPVTFASYLVRLRVRPEHNPHWLNYLLNSFRFWAFARSQALVSLHQANLNSSRYGRMNIPVPPRVDQDSIVEQINEQTGAIDTAIARTEREIALMQEYRTRLTADIVTGKLDVRKAAARLPELPPDAPPETAEDNAPDDLENEESHE